jgi:hypothetical protein
MAFNPSRERRLRSGLSDAEMRTLEAFRDFYRETTLSDLELERSIGIGHQILRRVMDGHSLVNGRTVKLLASFLKEDR